MYRAYSSNAKFVNAANMPQINFMAAAVVEMYSINAGEWLHASLVWVGSWLIDSVAVMVAACSCLVSACFQLHSSAGSAGTVCSDWQEQGFVPRGVLLAGQSLSRALRLCSCARATHLFEQATRILAPCFCIIVCCVADNQLPGAVVKAACGQGRGARAAPPHLPGHAGTRGNSLVVQPSCHL